MSTSAWTPYEPIDAEPWDLRRVVHLHRRTGFAATWEEIQRDLQAEPQSAVENALTGNARSTGVPTDFFTMADLIGEAAVSAGNADRLQAWWVYRMLYSPDPLAERLGLMWHNHFATSNLKVDDVGLMWEQNELFRKHGRDPFGDLLQRVIKHPAMLIWLDAESNRSEHPNENLARELMELFTLGEGNYSEQDVKEAARALTGWTVSRREFRFVEKRHDNGEKTVLGRAGAHGGDELLEILLNHPAVARRLAGRLCETFMGEATVNDAALDELASGLRQRHLDIGWAVETILRSKLFFADENLGSRVLSPAEYVVGAVRVLEAFDPPVSTLLLAEQIARLGQSLFYPPNVFGWDGGRTWINTPSVIARGNFVAHLLEGTLRNPVEPIDVVGLAEQHGGGSSPSDVLGFLARLVTGKASDTGPVSADTDVPLAHVVAAFLASPHAQSG